MKIEAFSINQKGGLDDVKIYVSLMKALDLIERYAIDRWTLENKRGYQHIPRC